MKRLVLAEIARADLASIRRYSTRTWGRDQTSKYMDALRDTMKGLVRGTVFTRTRDDLRPAIQMARSGSHSIFFEVEESRILIVRAFTRVWTTAATWTPRLVPTKKTESAPVRRRSPLLGRARCQALISSEDYGASAAPGA